MGTAKKSQVKMVRFELARRSILGIAVVVFCLFLWMFLLGVWAGQSLLVPSAYENKALITDDKAKVGERVATKADKK
ncbi:MAG: hypothetical protein OEL83_16490 [Desulforhopalus sp.]|nr:hypothetical protein [Desulforhopalus sp.]